MSHDTGDRLRKALSEALSGAGGIILSAYFVYPIDFVKVGPLHPPRSLAVALTGAHPLLPLCALLRCVQTRLQLPGSPYSSMSNGFRRIIAEEGFLTLYQGVESELLKGSLQNFIYLFAYDLLKGYARDEKMLTVVAEDRGPKVSHTRPLLNRTLHCYCHGSGTSGVRYAYRKEKRKDTTDGALRERRVSVSSDGRAGEEGDDALSFDSDRHTRQIVKVIATPRPLNPTSSKPSTSPGPASSTSSSSSSTSGPSTSPSSAPSKSAPPQLSILSNLLIGIVAGCFCQLFINPLSVIQTRLMTQAKQAGVSPTAVKASSSILSTAVQIWRSEGFLAFYTGLLPAFILTSNPAIQFLVFDRLKAMLEMILQQHQSTRPINALESFVIGAVAKISATLATYPYIMAKLRLQYRGPLPAGQQPYKGTLDVIVSILRQDGMMGLYAGLRAQLLKSVLGAALMFMMKEQLTILSDRLVKRKQP